MVGQQALSVVVVVVGTSAVGKVAKAVMARVAISARVVVAAVLPMQVEQVPHHHRSQQVEALVTDP